MSVYTVTWLGEDIALGDPIWHLEATDEEIARVRAWAFRTHGDDNPHIGLLEEPCSFEEFADVVGLLSEAELEAGVVLYSRELA